MGKFVPSHSYSKILKDQVLFDWFCTRPLSFSSFTYRENVCHGSILHAYSISILHACTVYSYYTHGTRVYSILHAWYTHGVMPRVLLCKLCACVMRVFCVSSACRTRGLFKLWVICTVCTYQYITLLASLIYFWRAVSRPQRPLWICPCIPADFMKLQS